MTTIAASLVSHTNVGKTTLARTLLGRDIGEVRDAPHVTEFAEVHLLIDTSAGDRLELWDTPGFGNSVRLARRMRAAGSPLGWLLTQVWDRWRDRPFWASQQALRHVQAEAEVVLYLVNAAEQPQAAGYVAPEMDILGWVGKPVVVLLNQLGAPRPAADEAADVERWRAHLAAWPLVRGVLPKDAFARCWVQEAALLDAIADALAGEPAAAMRRLAHAWAERRRSTFEAAIGLLADSLARAAAMRQPVERGLRMADRWRALAGVIGLRRGDTDDGDPAQVAQAALAAALDDEVRTSTTQLVALHGLAGRADGEILDRLAEQVQHHERVPVGRAAVLGGALAGALAGLKADIATGGHTLGGGLVAGGLIGALGAAGLARGINLVRGTEQSWVSWNAQALDALAEGALLRYLAVAHFGRGRGQWVAGESPPHWRALGTEVLAPRRDALAALWAGRSRKADGAADDAQRIAAALRPLLQAAAEDLLARLYPGALHAAHNRAP